MSHLADNIRKIRSLLSKTQQEFADDFGVTVAMEKSYEKGKASPGIIYMSRLQDITGRSAAELSEKAIPAGTIDVGDLLHDSQSAIRIYGNSMLPNYPPGCVVGLIKCSNAFIEPGEVYVIETRDRRMLKRLFYPNDDHKSSKLTCYSDNIMKFEGGARNGLLAYPPFEIDKSDIVNLYTVTGVIKRNANSIVINR